MNKLPIANINLTLVGDYNLSDSALLTYAMIDAYSGYKSEAYISITDFGKKIFNSGAQGRTSMIKNGIAELTKKGLITRLQRNIYDTRKLGRYKREQSVQVEMDLVKKLGTIANTRNIAPGLLKTYVVMKYQLESSKNSVCGTTKQRLTEQSHCSFQAIERRLSILNEFNLFKIQNFSNKEIHWKTVFNTVWYSDPKNEKDLIKVVSKLPLKKGRNACAA